MQLSAKLERTHSSRGGQFVVIFQKVPKNSIFDQILTSTPRPNVPPSPTYPRQHIPPPPNVPPQRKPPFPPTYPPLPLLCNTQPTTYPHPPNLPPPNVSPQTYPPNPRRTPPPPNVPHPPT